MQITRKAGKVNLLEKEVGVPCPKCGNKIKKTLAWLASNDQLVCACGARLRFNTDEFASGIKGVQQALDDFGKPKP